MLSYLISFLIYFIAFITSILTIAYCLLLIKDSIKYRIFNTIEYSFLSVLNIVLFIVSVKLFTYAMINLQVVLN